MAAIFDEVSRIIANTCDIPLNKITPASVLDAEGDTGCLDIDSLDRLDIIYSVDHTFGVKIPLDKWDYDISDGKASNTDYYRLDNFCNHVDALLRRPPKAA